MTTMEWIGLIIGLLVLGTRLPAVVWPGPYRERVLGILARSGPGLLRAIGAFLWILVIAIVVLVVRRLTLLQGVLLVLAVLFAAAGTLALVSPDGYRRFSESLLGGMPEWAIRAAAVVGVTLGSWLVYLSLRGV